MHRVYRRSGVSGGTMFAKSFQPFLIIDSLAPGGYAFGVPVFYDRNDFTSEDYFFGDSAPASQQIYDPFHICCAFGPSDIAEEDGWTEGEIIHASWNQYRKRYEVAYSFGLTRKAQLSGNLTAGGSATASIQAKQRDGTDLAGIPGITLYHWGDSGSDTIPTGTPVMATYESSARRWYTDAFYRTP